MSPATPLYVFGEVLVDSFPNGSEVLGGAPFNVAWHLQAFGDQPRLISRISADKAGHQISQAISNWGMSCSDLQLDRVHPSGRVDVSFSDGEPNYDIVTDCAYDFINQAELKTPFEPGILYHGSLGLRNLDSAKALATLSSQTAMKIFLDVNLRPPWWQKRQLECWLRTANWVKLNEQELFQITASKGTLEEQMAWLQEQFELDHVILTRGEQGALVRTRDGEIDSAPADLSGPVIDTVGAGDAFSAVYIHGLRHRWPIKQTLHYAQKFAKRVVGLRGATTTDQKFYNNIFDGLDDPTTQR